MSDDLKSIEQYRFDICQDGIVVSSVIGPRDLAFSNALHYLLVYSQGGPAELRIPKGCEDMVKHLRDGLPGMRR